MNLVTTGPKVLIVEDEILIADRIERYLRRDGDYVVSGPAVDVPEARTAFETEAPDLVLLDIRLAGPETGIDFAHWLRDRSPTTPVVYLTSQFDEGYLTRAKATFPAGYLTKPIQAPTLLATVAVALHRSAETQNSSPADGAATGTPAATPAGADAHPRATLTINDGTSRRIVDPAAIRYVRADHVYAVYVLADGTTVTQRSSLSEAEALLGGGDFVRVHRGYIVNVARVTAYTTTSVTVDGEDEVPMSRTRRASFEAQLRKRGAGPVA